MKKWLPITKEKPNTASIVMLLHKTGDWDIGDRLHQGGKWFVVLNKNGNIARYGHTHWCPIQWPGEK